MLVRQCGGRQTNTLISFFLASERPINPIRIGKKLIWWREQKTQKQGVNEKTEAPLIILKLLAHNILRISYTCLHPPSPALSLLLPIKSLTLKKEKNPPSLSIYSFIYSLMQQKVKYVGKALHEALVTLVNETEIVSALRELTVLWGRQTLKYDCKNH